jgi:hypothetical protein
MRGLRLAAVMAAVAGAAACGPPPLHHALPSSDALARAILQALEQRDVRRLRALAVDEREFQRRVWPGLPAARPERNLPWSYVWMDLRQKSDTTLRRTFAAHAGRRYVLDTVRFTGESTTHGDFRVFRDTVLVVRDVAGVQHDLRILGSMIEADDGWKVFSYVVDQ